MTRMSQMPSKPRYYGGGPGTNVEDVVWYHTRYDGEDDEGPLDVEVKRTDENATLVKSCGTWCDSAFVTETLARKYSTPNLGPAAGGNLMQVRSHTNCGVSGCCSVHACQ